MLTLIVKFTRTLRSSTKGFPQLGYLQISDHINSYRGTSFMQSSTPSHKLLKSAGKAPLSTCHRPFCSVMALNHSVALHGSSHPLFCCLKPACHIAPHAGSHLRVVMDGSRHNYAELFVIHCQDGCTVGVVGTPAQLTIQMLPSGSQLCQALIKPQHKRCADKQWWHHKLLMASYCKQ